MYLEVRIINFYFTKSLVIYSKDNKINDYVDLIGFQMSLKY